MPIEEATHPLIAQKLTKLRDVRTAPRDFRRLLREVTFYLGFEATRNLKTKDITIDTPMVKGVKGKHVGENVAIVPILRAGLAMADGMLELMPDAAVHHIGMYRAKESLLPIQYYNRLPKGSSCDIAYVVDPCIATANTIHAVVTILKRWGAKKIVVIATVGARPGVDRLQELHPDLDIFIGAIDNELSKEGMILPGLGDAGDRQFGTVDEIPDLMPTSTGPSILEKRKHDQA